MNSFPHPRRRTMFLRMMLRSASLGRARSLTALLAIVVCATVATALFTLQADLDSKLRREFRSYGANIVLLPRAGQSFPADALASVDSLLPARALAVPFAYAVARTSSGSSIVVAGTDFDRVRRLDTWWRVTRWPSAPGQALVGHRALAALDPGSGTFKLSFKGAELPLTAYGDLQTGAAEDSRIYLDLAEFQRWTSASASASAGAVPLSAIEVAATGTPAELDALVARLSAALPYADVHPVRRLVEAEGRVIGKTRSLVLASAIMIAVVVTLCVLAALTASVFERRKDFALMTALGASRSLINGLFAAEAGVLGVAGAIIGFGTGLLVAIWIGRVNFHAAVEIRPQVFPAVMGISLGVTLLAALVPLSLLRRFQPAVMLKGE